MAYKMLRFYFILEHYLIDMKYKHLLGLIIILNNYVSGFYVPGVAPKEFKQGEAVEVKVSLLHLYNLIMIAC